jgi:hypothetical protein
MGVAAALVLLLSRASRIQARTTVRDDAVPEKPPPLQPPKYEPEAKPNTFPQVVRPEGLEPPVF